MEDLGRALGLLHIMDLVLAAIVLGTAVFGFTQGTFKLLLIFISVIAGFFMATVFYIPFTNIIAPFFGLRVSGSGARPNDVIVGNATSFALLNVIIALLVGYLLFSFVGHWEIRGRFQSMFDKPLGMFLGFIAGLVIAAILVTLVSVPYEIVNSLNITNPQGQAGTILHQWYQQSWLGTPLRCGFMSYLLDQMGRLPLVTVPAILNQPCGSGGNADLLFLLLRLL